MLLVLALKKTAKLHPSSMKVCSILENMGKGLEKKGAKIQLHVNSQVPQLL